MKLKGIIMILSCKKYINNRVKINFTDNNVNQWSDEWKFVSIIGDDNIDTNYIFDSKKYILTVKCEDSYIHLLKKRGLGIKYIQQIFNIEEGILCCGDDVLFNRKILFKYLCSNNKNDYEGKNSSILSNYNPSDKSLLKNTVNDLYMYNYYKVHPKQIIHTDFTLDYLKDICKRPNVFGAGGACFYLSNKSCIILVNHMENINYNIFHHDKFTNSYPYTIEDAGISFILYYNNITFINNKYFWTTKRNTETNNYLCFFHPETWYTNIRDLKWRL